MLMFFLLTGKVDRGRWRRRPPRTLLDEVSPGLICSDRPNNSVSWHLTCLPRKEMLKKIITLITLHVCVAKRIHLMGIHPRAPEEGAHSGTAQFGQTNALIIIIIRGPTLNEILCKITWDFRGL
jgi:hypothetical protein